MSEISFYNPKWLYLLIVLPFLIYWYVAWEKKTHPRLLFSSSAFAKGVGKSLKQKFLPINYILRLLCLGFLVFALARPQSTIKNSSKTIEGVDIVLSVDISGSMLAEDFKPNRMESAKKVASDFIAGRKDDRMAIVAFSAEAFTQCPLTIDKRILQNRLKELKSGLILDGTALGDGLSVSINRIKDSDAKSKLIILLTDGVNNSGSIDPITAAELAKLFNIRVYTIGVGTQGYAPYPFQTPFGVQYQNVEVNIDEKLLKEIANSTGGEYFRATNQKKLEEIFAQIDNLEKTKIDVLSYEERSDLFFPLILIGLVLFVAEILCRVFVFRSIP